jgi:chemosensory pili system protein ChpA (sensor histidine kinase/response regulator)
MKALEMLQGELPDVILMDIEMPVMNGFDASQAIRATPQTSGIPIIMITSRAGESHRQRAFEIGVNEYLGKPYNENDLIRLIRKFAGNEDAEKVVNG